MEEYASVFGPLFKPTRATYRRRAKALMAAGDRLVCTVNRCSKTPAYGYRGSIVTRTKYVCPRHLIDVLYTRLECNSDLFADEITLWRLTPSSYLYPIKPWRMPARTPPSCPGRHRSAGVTKP